MFMFQEDVPNTDKGFKAMFQAFSGHLVTPNFPTLKTKIKLAHTYIQSRGLIS